MKISAFFTRDCVLVRDAPDDDPQVVAIYNLDREIIGACINTRCPRAHLEAVIRHACRQWGVRAPRLKVLRLDDRTFGQCDDDGIELNRAFHGNNLTVLLHELAHWINDRLLEGEDYEAHGPEFAGIYMELLDQYKILPRDAFRVIARRLGVRYKAPKAG